MVVASAVSHDPVIVGIGDDPLAFVAAVRPHLSRMQRLATRLHGGSDAEDVVQEALLRVWRYRNRYDPRRGSLASWLLVIVANEAHRAARGSRVGWAWRPALVAEVDRRLDVEAAVNQLPPRQRLAINCFYFAGLDIAETAAVMSCSEGTVKSTLADARVRLRKVLKEPTDEQ